VQLHLMNDNSSFHPVHSRRREIGPQLLHHAKGRGLLQAIAAPQGEEGMLGHRRGVSPHAKFSKASESSRQQQTINARQAPSPPGLIQSVSQAFLPGLRAWVEVGGIAPSQ
jgi:hypothetical protein